MRHLVLVTVSFFAIYASVIADLCEKPQSSINKYVIFEQKVTFHEGYIKCIQGGLDPAEVVSEKDHKQLMEAMQYDTKLGVDNGYWIFATNLANHVSYYWLHSGRPIFYSAFSPGQPDNLANKENCLEVLRAPTGDLVWNDVSCDFLLKFACQYKQNDIESYPSIDVRIADV